MDESPDARSILNAVPQRGEGQLGWMTILQNDSSSAQPFPWRTLSNWLWISRCGDYWQQADLRTDSACRILMIGKKAIGVTCVNSVIDECKAIGGIDVRQLVLSVGLPVIHNSQSRQTPHCHNNILVMYMFIYYTIVEMYMDHSDM